MSNVVAYDEKKLDLIRRMCAEKATPDEFEVFLEVAKRTGMNPLAREIYCVKYDGSKPAQIFVGKDGYVKRAGQFETYDGHEAGYFDEMGHESKMPLPGAKIIGAWCRVFRKDRHHPVETFVLLSEYKKEQATWKTMPYYMIKKVAISQAHREAFLADFAGTYDESEAGNIQDASITVSFSQMKEEVAKKEEAPAADAPAKVDSAKKGDDDIADQADVEAFWKNVEKKRLADFLASEEEHNAVRVGAKMKDLRDLYVALAKRAKEAV